MNEHNPWNPLTRLSVAISPLDHDAVLLGGKQTINLMRHARLQRIDRDYLHFTPLDRTLSWLPSGTQYYAYGFR